MQLGNGRWESTQFNSRLQPTQIALGTVQNATDKLKLNFTYNTTGQNDNNGNVLSQTIIVPTETRGTTTYNGFTAVQTYTYDSLNRIKQATETVSGQSGNNWQQTFQYDRYGNRQFEEALTSTLPKNCGTSPNFTVCTADNPQAQTANNKFSTTDGFYYDNAGNTTRDAQNRKFTYDGENKQTKVETVDINGNVTGTLGIYYYDGDGKRVKKEALEDNQWVTTIFVYDAGGKLVAEYSTVIASQQDAKVSYLTSDNLGSPRINTDQNGAVIARHDYQPFGEEIQRASYGADAVRKQFATYERDKETDLDFAEARYYNFNHGRFTGVDPLLESAEPALPRTWNRYVYCLNNPLNLIDPDGQQWEFVGNDKVNAEELKKAFEAAVKAQGEKAWEAYQAIEKAKGTIKVGFGDLGETTSGTTDVHISFGLKSRSLTGVSGSITIGTNAKALDISNFTDLTTASGHEFTHVLTTLANNKIKDLSDLAPADGLTNEERNAGKDSFPAEEAAFDAQVRAKNAAVAGGSKPLSPHTALQRSTNAIENAKSREEKYDLIKSYGYDLKQPRPGAQPANRTTNKVNKKP